MSSATPMATTLPAATSKAKNMTANADWPGPKPMRRPKYHSRLRKARRASDSKPSDGCSLGGRGPHVGQWRGGADLGHGVEVVGGRRRRGGPLQGEALVGIVTGDGAVGEDDAAQQVEEEQHHAEHD